MREEQFDAVSTSRRMQEEHRAKGKKLYMCFVDLEKALDRVPQKVMELALKTDNHTHPSLIH